MDQRWASDAYNTPQQRRSMMETTSGQYEAYSSPAAFTRGASATYNPPRLQPQPRTTSLAGDYEGDHRMEDADPYNSQKYNSRAAHHQRPSSQYLGQEEQSASQRFSPMNLSSTSPASMHLSIQIQPTTLTHRISVNRLPG